MMVTSDLLSPIEVSICFSRLILPSLPSLVCNHLYSTTNLLFPNWPEVVNLYPVPKILPTDMITNGNFFLPSLNVLLSKVIDFFVQSGGRSTNMQLVRSHVFLYNCGMTLSNIYIGSITFLWTMPDMIFVKSFTQAHTLTSTNLPEESA